MTEPRREEEPSSGPGVTAGVAEHHLGAAPDEATVSAAAGQATAPAATTTVSVAGLEPTEAPPAEQASEPPVEQASEPPTVFDGQLTEAPLDEARHSGTEPLDEELPTRDPTSSGDPPQTQVVAGLTRVVCPNCETVWEGNDLRPHAAWFCAQCQFPLFWANAGVRTAEATTDDALSRLPGTAGRATLSAIDCPNCGERNQPDPEGFCWRCHAPLTPRDPLPAPLPLPQIVVAAPVVEPPRRRIWPWIVATGALALLALVLLVVLLWGD